jgi:polar amino acid transport system substrate-binding protein
MLRGRVCRASVVVLLTLSLIAGAARHTCAASLDQMQQSRFLRICANPAALPYSNRSARNGPPGFQLELGEAIAREMGLRLALVWSSALNAGRSMECDASLDAIA